MVTVSMDSEWFYGYSKYKLNDSIDTGSMD